MLSKCETCKFTCREWNQFPCCSCNVYKTKNHADNYEPMTRFQQFREQTATIEGLVEWCVDREMCFCCDYLLECSADKDFDGTTDCKAGIKAYWEGELE